jgi:hypothetical protein
MKTLFALVVMLAVGSTAAWAHRQICTTNCNNQGYCFTSCTDYDY